MITVAHVIGIDPGLIDTGVVRMVFKPGHRTIEVEHTVFNGGLDDLHDWVYPAHSVAKKWVYVEKYRPRVGYSTDVDMVKMEAEIKRVLPEAQLLQNMGVKRVIPQSLMEVFGVWSWSTVTHHQDLRSAARIALLGMVKDPQLNGIMADVVRDHLEGRPWRVHYS